MKTTPCYKQFVARYLALGAVGVAAGLTAVSPAAASAPNPPVEALGQPVLAGTFANRLSVLRSAVSEHLDREFTLAQVLPHPPPPPPPKPFLSTFGKAPFSDAFRNVPPPPKLA